MSRLIVVSNRLPPGRTGRALDPRDAPVGGLTTAILAALRRRPGSLWLGWNGEAVEAKQGSSAIRGTCSGVELLGIPLTTTEVDDYYHGYCNRTLWPLLHCFQDKVRIRLKQERAYRAIQARFAAVLRPLLRPGDLVWVHDYHFFLLGRELRRLGWTGRVGFFLHTPFPPHELWDLQPRSEEVLDALLDYDVVGFHVQGFLENYLHCCRRLLGVRPTGSRLDAGGRHQRAAVYPVGIDPADFLPVGRDFEDGHKHSGSLIRALRNRSLILGVDRLDYTKGIPERIQAYERFIQQNVEWRKKVVYVQVASPSRSQVPEYAEQRRRIEALLGRVNGELGEHDWMPIRYLYRSYDRGFLAKLYRQADIGLVTPLRDGMNLVAKEFVAAQDPGDPGVLVLSRCAGAAEQMREAVLVNPFIPADVAEGIRHALSMPRQERRARHAALLVRVKADTANGWAQRFLEDLESGMGLAEVGAASAHELDLSGLSWGSVGQGAGRRDR